MAITIPAHTNLVEAADLPGLLTWLDSEIALLLAVRERITSFIPTVAGDCHIEFDTLAHAASGHVGIIIATGGVQPGDANEAEMTQHAVFSVKTTVFMRAGHIPRDRKRNLFYDTTGYTGLAASLNSYIHGLQWLIDGDYDVMNHASEIVAANGDTRDGFVKPLRWLSTDPEPSVADPDLFASHHSGRAHTDTVTGLKRTIYFGRAERITTRQNFKLVS